ncbi:NADH dehydrogenase [ubiquinone] 1 beta subcomplex subunit 2, mitochondrial [Ornithorhynchus anatinus]|nr:NADH dehydrogenase [ubiquinone] 1 beta subcomplex subunit 2, mitochondrial [Ornithorhynchus anatinus]
MAALGRLGPALRAGGRRLLAARGRPPAAAAAGPRHAGGGVHIPPQYRQYPQLTKSQVFQAELWSGVMWFWILWRFWHDSDAVLGHFPYPDASQWTDEELGIPPDDED